MDMMRKLTLLLLVLLGMGSAVMAYNNTYVVLVGVADYKYDYAINDLPYTLNNTTAMYNFFTSKKGGSVPASNIYLLTDSNASKDNIIRKSKELFAKAKKNDRVILYIAGHGGDGFFAPYDYDQTYESLLFYSDIKAIFRSARCNTKLLFIDTCYAGGIKVGLGKAEKNGKDRTSTDNLNIAVMSASGAKEVSWQSSDIQKGVFTHYLIEGLGGAANRDGNKYITIQELYYYVYHKVQEKTQSESYDSMQTPQLFGKFDLRLIVANVY